MTRLFACLPLLPLVLAAPALAADDEKKPPAFQMTDNEKALLDLTNAERAKEKLPPLAANPVLFRIARQHSANMAKKGELNHVLDGKSMADRTRAGGYDYTQLAENISVSDSVVPKEIVAKWMKSEVYRDNILRSGFEEIGMGIARNDKGEIYYTQLFATPRKAR
jgi:uncharacterized protein YkwD